MVLAAAIVGASFVWIAIALRSIDPGTIAFGRAALGAGALVVIPAARCAVRRLDWPRLVLASLFGMAVPALLFSFAEQRISSALTGMLVSAIPIMTAALAVVHTRVWPTMKRSVGLVVGSAGIVLLAAPTLNELGGEAIGIVMVLGAVLGYAIANTLFAPLERTYGSLGVTMWVLVLSTVMLLPLGVLGLRSSSFEFAPVSSLLFLGLLGTATVGYLFVGLVGRLGAVRASLIGYLIPVIALGLGVTVLDERVELIQLVGVGVTLLGGYIVSRGDPRHIAGDQRVAEDTAA